MIQDIYPDKFHKLYSYNTIIENNDFVIIFNKKNVLLKNINNQFLIPKAEELDIIDKNKLELLGKSNGSNYFVTSYENIQKISGDFINKDIYTILKSFPKLEKWIISLAEQTLKWYEVNKFCGQCGNKFSKSKTEKALTCSNCGNTIYPKVSPAVIVGIINEDKILLVQGKSFPEKFYSIAAGYCEPGETLEETVIREIKEETGLTLKIENIKYYKSQPWPLSESMMVGFFAKYDGNEEIIVDQQELNDAKWFTRDKMPLLPGNISIAREMIDYFLNKENIF